MKRYWIAGRYNNDPFQMFKDFYSKTQAEKYLAEKSRNMSRNWIFILIEGY